MVRINIIDPKQLMDQHLIAEYNEILILLGYVRKYPKLSEVPDRYCLGKGHVLFFKNKLRYLKKRHDMLSREMVRRGFRPRKSIKLEGFARELRGDWKPQPRDFKIIRKRLREKIESKPGYYRYFGKNIA